MLLGQYNIIQSVDASVAMIYRFSHSCLFLSATLALSLLDCVYGFLHEPVSDNMSNFYCCNISICSHVTAELTFLSTSAVLLHS